MPSEMKHLAEEIKEELERDEKEIKDLTDDLNRLQDESIGNQIQSFNPSFVLWNHEIRSFLDLKYSDSSLQSQHIKDCLMMDEWHERQLCRLKDQYKSIVDSIDTLDGWSQSSHSLFLKLMQEYSLQSQNRFTLFLHRLQLEFKARSLNFGNLDISRHYDWILGLNSYEMKKTLIEEMAVRNREAFIQTTLKHFKTEQEMIERIELQEIQQKEKLGQLASYHVQVREWREKRIIQMKNEAKERKVAMDAELEREMIKLMQGAYI
jgi:hypothetical protein